MAGRSTQARLVLVGGIDPSGGAGLFRDLWAAREMGFEGELVCVPTAFTFQGDGRPARASAVKEKLFEALCLRAELFAPRTTVKVGLVSGVALDWLTRSFAAHASSSLLVVDPVQGASDGGALAEELGVRVDRLRELLAYAQVVTPNAQELAWLRDPSADAVDSSVDSIVESTGADRQSCAWLHKNCQGVHADGRVVDLLMRGGRELARWERASFDGPDPRGTGCALSTAIAVGLAQGKEVRHACEDAIVWLDQARRHTRSSRDGRAHMCSESKGPSF